jgi:hypothetical protein
LIYERLGPAFTASLAAHRSHFPDNGGGNKA